MILILPAWKLERIKVPTLFAELIRKSENIKVLRADGDNRCCWRSENEDSLDFSQLRLDVSRSVDNCFCALDVSIKAVEEQTRPRAGNCTASSASTHRRAPEGEAKLQSSQKIISLSFPITRRCLQAN